MSTLDPRVAVEAFLARHDREHLSLYGFPSPLANMPTVRELMIMLLDESL